MFAAATVAGTKINTEHKAEKTELCFYVLANV